MRTPIIKPLQKKGVFYPLENYDYAKRSLWFTEYFNDFECFNIQI